MAKADRDKRWQFNAAGISVDLRRSVIDDKPLSSIMLLAKSRRLPEKITELLGGEKINNTEARAVQHSALRAIFEQPLAANAAEA
ncbi:MAG: hypothetical protein WBN40_10220, partial [Pseudomonadales bacterium]